MNFLSLSLIVLFLSGCAEIKKIISVFTHGNVSVNTSAFEITEMSSGSDVTCSIMGDKSIRCLGSTMNGNLGRFYGAPNNFLKDVKQVAAGKGFTCSISGENSTVKCFGLNDKGQLGNGTASASIEPLAVLDSENGNSPIIEAKQITAGDSHACAIMKNGRTVCWGDNSFGQLGNPKLENGSVKPVMENEKSPRPFQGIQSVVAGGNSTCIVARDDLSLFCFGERAGSTKKINWLPEKIDVSGGIVTISQVKQVALGDRFGCALSRSQVFCWGLNDSKQLGTSSNVSVAMKASPVEVHYPFKAPLSKIEAIAVGNKHACALHRDEGSVYCWGNNEFGQLGTTSTHGLPEQVAVGSNNLSLKGAKSIAAGRDRTCIISSGDELFCWGNGEHGILGNELISISFPSRVKDSNNDMISGSVAISIGFDHSCVIGNNKKLFCFGLNQYGQIGSKLIGSSLISNVLSLDTYGEKTCVVYGEKKTVGCFGGRDLKNITEEKKTNSFLVEDLKINNKIFQDSTGVAVGDNHVCVINSEQMVECIDYDTKPANHFTVQTEKKTPLKDIWLVRSRGKWNCGITREKGEIWCWGDWKNNQWPTAKQITFASKPTTDFIQLSISEDQICGIHGVTGTVYCTTETETAQNAFNMQSLNESNTKQLSGVFNLTAGKHHVCALDDKNHLFCWGSNESGQLGLTSFKYFNTPQRISIKDESHHKITRVSAGDERTCFSTESDFSLFCFGKGFFNEGNSTTPIEYPL